MKPSWDEQRRNEPRTDRKFRAEDEHLAADNKEEVVESESHSDEAPPQQHKGAMKAPDTSRKGHPPKS